MKAHQRAVVSALSLTSLISVSAASDLLLDGQEDAVVPYGAAFNLALSGAPNLPGFVFVDSSPGPISLFGETIEIGFTPSFSLLLPLTTSAGGTYAVDFPLPHNPGLTGAQVFLLGLLLDPADPNGLDFSNGASLSIVPPVGAGDNQATLVGRAVSLNGSDATLADGHLPPGSQALWQLISSPPGSVESIHNADTVFGSFTPDVAGDYLMRFSITQSGVSVSADTTVHAWQIDHLPGHAGGWVDSATVDVTGILSGPPAQSLTLDGVPLSVTSGGDFGPETIDVDASRVFDCYTLELTHADGSVARELHNFGVGPGAPLSQPAVSSLAAHLNQSGMDEVADLAEVELEKVDLEQFLIDLPPHELANDQGLWGFTIFSATIDFNAMTHNPDMDLALSAGAGGMGGLINLYDVDVDFDVSGKVLEIPYSLTGSMQSSPIDLSASLTGSVQDAQLDLALSGIDVIRHNFSFGLDGFLGSIAELFIIEDGVKADVEDAIETQVGAQLGPAIETVLNGFELALNLNELLGIDVDVDLDFADVTHTGSGVTIALSAATAVNSVSPGAPPITSYRSTPSAAPSFGPTTPSGLGFAEAVAVNDDFVNLFLAAVTAAGLLEGDLTQLLPKDPGSPGEVLTTEALELLFPDAGFELFPSGTELKLHASGGLPPVVSTTPAGPGLVRIDLGGLLITFEVPEEGGAAVPVLRVQLDGSVDSTVDIDAEGTLVLSLVGTEVTPTVLAGFPGSNLSSLQAGADFLIALLVPQLVELIGSIPIPSLEEFGLILTAEEIAPTGGNEEYLGFWGSVQFVGAP